MHDDYRPIEHADNGVGTMIVKSNGMARTWVRVVRGFLWFWTATLLVISLQSARPVQIHSGPFHRVLHVLAFAMLAVLVAAGFGAIGTMGTRAVLCIIFGAALETAQHLVFRTSLEWRDVGDDALGAAVATAAWQLSRYLFYLRVQRLCISPDVSHHNDAGHKRE